MPLPRRVSSVSDKVVQTYKFVRRPSGRSARDVQVTAPAPAEIDNNQIHTTTSQYCEAEPQTEDYHHEMYGHSDSAVQLHDRVDTVDVVRATPADPSNIKGRMNGHAYYNDTFALREEGKKIPPAAAVWVEMKTNVILENEFEFIKSLSQVIAKRFSRTEDTVALSVQHSSCMIMGGTFDGCYFMTITSMSSISPTCNKRNVALISDWLSTNLGVPSSRGYIRFVEPDAGNYAMGGVTCLDMLEKERSATRMSMANPDGSSKTKRGFLSGRTSRMERLDENRSPIMTPADCLSIDTGRETAQSTYDEKRAAQKRAKSSMFQIFGRSHRVQA